MSKTHGMSHTSTHDTWMRMLSRCYCQTAKCYPDYGGRGITVCDRWRESFKNFLADMGERPSQKHSLDRINNDGGYWCGKCDDCCIRGAITCNCRWATRTQQSRNRRGLRRLSAFGKVQCVSEWAEEYGVSCWFIFNRLNRGWSVEDALSLPNRGVTFARGARGRFVRLKGATDET